MNHRHSLSHPGTPTCKPTLVPIARLALGGFIALAVPLAHAQDMTPHNYWGASIGTSRAKSDDAGLATVLPSGVSATGISRDNSDQSYKLFGGHQFNRNLALEGGYFNLGKTDFSANTAPAGTLGGQRRVQGINLDLVGTLPVTERFAFLGRVGAQYARSKASYSGTGAASGVSTGDSNSGTNMKLGLGVQYAITPAVWVRGEIERYRVKALAGHGRNIDTATISVVFPFGRTAPMRVAAAVPATPMPQVVAQAPAPAPAPAPVLAPPEPAPTPPPTPQRVSFAAETLFGFDAAALRPEGKAALDDFGRELKNTTYESVRVEGHTDRMGSSDYNQALSSRRAESVKSYLVDEVRLDAARVGASGMGERQPATASGACPDSMARSQRIACLQPDRRVDVEVTGTR